MIITLEKILKDQKARRGKEEGISKKLQWEPIQRFPITGLAFLPLGALHRLYCLGHKLGDGPRHIALPYIELEVTCRFSFLSRGLPKGVPHKLTLIPERFPSLIPDGQRGIHISSASPIVETLPSQVLGLLGGPLDGMHETKWSCRAGEAAQFVTNRHPSAPPPSPLLVDQPLNFPLI
ncbi:LOW QUALITY PROTEIN: hypothetical protein Cgig2_019212 [Carnegiea gigantea]|uniref:Uncharacterized protein n=1 Tax=Carnegiea gigantea TaxID=171969 RepID=A0A9Q1JPP2_9CARY|nr:LOW QUALITY PROTEIN: hypothetical protein Cgig2_019212 [Carnegiea gigantea]